MFCSEVNRFHGVQNEYTVVAIMFVLVCRYLVLWKYTSLIPVCMSIFCHSSVCFSICLVAMYFYMSICLLLYPPYVLLCIVMCPKYVLQTLCHYTFTLCFDFVFSVFTLCSLCFCIPTQKQLKLLCCNISYFIAEVSTWSSTASLMKPIRAETVDCLRSFSKLNSMFFCVSLYPPYSICIHLMCFGVFLHPHIIFLCVSILTFCASGCTSIFYVYLCTIFLYTWTISVWYIDMQTAFLSSICFIFLDQVGVRLDYAPEFVPVGVKTLDNWIMNKTCHPAHWERQF